MEGLPPEDPLAEIVQRYRYSNQVEHQHLCAVAGALSEVIQEQHLSPSPTAYFAAIMASLESQQARRNDQVTAATCMLLSIILPKVPPAVLRSKLDAALPLMAGLLAAGPPIPATKAKGKGGASARAVGSGAVKAGLTCLQHLLVGADKSNWPKIGRPFGLVLAHCVDARPKIRRRAHDVASEILSSMQGTPSLVPASDAVGALTDRIITAATSAPTAAGKGSGEAAAAAASEALHLLRALRFLMSRMATRPAGVVGRRLAELHGLGQPVVTRHVVDVLLSVCGGPGYPVPTPTSMTAVGLDALSLSDVLTRVLGHQQEAAARPDGKGPDADSAAAVARLVRAGMLRLHTMDPILCGQRLPLAFQVVAQNLTLEGEEAVFASGECLRALLAGCVDEALVRAGVVAEAGRGKERSKGARPPIERVALVLESMLGYQYAATWDVALLVVAEAYQRFGPAGSVLLTAVTRSLGELHDLPTEDMPCPQQLNAALEAAVESMGPEAVLQVLPLNMGETTSNTDELDLSKARAWLLPLLARRTIGARLAFFGSHVLPLAAGLQERARRCRADKRPVAAKNAEACWAQVWSLFPAFCRYPADTSSSFRLIARQLGQAFESHAELRGPICLGLERLIRQSLAARDGPPAAAVDFTKATARGGAPASALASNATANAAAGNATYRAPVNFPTSLPLHRSTTSDDGEAHGGPEGNKEAGGGAETVSPAVARARAAYTPSMGAANVAAVVAFAHNFLPLLFNAFVVAVPERRAQLSSAIEAFASIAGAAQVQSFAETMMRKLLEATKDAEEVAKQPKGEAMETQVAGQAGGTKQGRTDNAVARRCTFMDLALALVPGMDVDGVGSLYRAAKPAVMDEEANVQKKAYKLVARLCERCPGFVERQADELLELLLASLPSALSAAKRPRLLCVRHVVRHLSSSADPRQDQAAATLLSEIILATKESNAKTRNLAYDLLIVMARDAEAAPGGTATLERFFSVVVGGLAGQTPHMVSASVVALSRLLYEFSTGLSHTVPELLPAVLLLLRSKSREVVKSVLGFVKVVIARLPADELQQHLGSLVEGLLNWSDDSKNHFKAKVKAIFERLVRRCGYEAVAELTPTEHQKLLANIRKTRDRSERRRKESEAGTVVDGAANGKARSMGATTTRTRAMTAKRSMWSHREVFSDEEEGEAGTSDGGTTTAGGSALRRAKSREGSMATRKSRKARRLHSRLPEDGAGSGAGDEPLDLLDSQRTRRALSSAEAGGRRGQPGWRPGAKEGDDFETNEDGKLVIGEERAGKKRKVRDAEDEDEDDEGGERRARSVGGRSSKKSQMGRGGRWDERGGKGKKIKGMRGDEYKARGGAGGDAKREGKMEPFAYWPLDPKMLNRREGKRAQARKGMVATVKPGKKKLGVERGTGKGGVHMSSGGRGKGGHKVHKGKGKGKR